MTAREPEKKYIISSLRITDLENNLPLYLVMPDGAKVSRETVIAEIRSRPHPAPAPDKALIFVPISSAELLVMADKEWTNREERKHRHDKASWISGWLDGYFSKPVSIKEHDAAIVRKAREDVLDAATLWLFDQFKQFTNGKYTFGDDWLADWWIERVGYLRTPEGQKELASLRQQDKGG